MVKTFTDWGSGCGSVGGAVASKARDPLFESSHRHILFTMNCIKKTKVKKRGREWPNRKNVHRNVEKEKCTFQADLT